MDRLFISITKDSLDTISVAPSFTQEDFHGAKRDSRNKIGDTHTIDRSLPRITQAILNWAQNKFGETSVGIYITSSRRTAQFNQLISSSGANGAHVKGIAIDFVFTGTRKADAWCDFKNEIIERGEFFQTLLSLGLGGIGIYGNKSGGKYFFHIDTRKSGDGLSMNQLLEGSKYGLWQKGDLSCTTDTDEETEEEYIDRVDRERATVKTSLANEYVKYTHPNEAGDVSVADIVSSPTFIGKDLTSKELIEIESDSKTNHRRIYEALTIKQKREYNSGDSSYNSQVEYPVVPGANINIPLSKIDVGINYDSNFTTTKVNFNEYFPPILRKITTDPGYVPAYLNRGLDAKQIRPQFKVIVWSRSNYLESPENTGYIDITEDLIAVNTSNTIESGGDFTIEVSGMSTEFVEDQQTKIVKPVRPTSMSGSVKSSSATERIFQVGQESASEYKRNTPYYLRVLAKSDVIFIAYEKLEIDGSLENSLEGKWYDMIGLIDHIESSSSEATQISLSIRGRSLISILMDDHSYFNPVSLGHQASIYGTDPLSNGRYLDSGFYELSATLSRTIQENIEFIFHRIVTVGYVPDDIFNMFTDKTITTKYSKKKVDETIEEERKVRGIWQIVKLFLDKNIANLKLADSSISNPEGSILDLIKKTCQDPFVEFFTDTYGDKFYLMARKPPFEQDSVIEAVYEIADEVDEQFTKYDTQTQNSVGGADNEATNKYLELISKRGESSSDTTIFGKVNELDEVRISTTNYPRIININEDDVIEENLRFSSQGYAWYQLEEQGNFLGAKMNIGMIPAIYFDEIAQIFGNRRLTVTSNYTTLNFSLDKNIDSNRNGYADQIAQQLGYLIETNIHLPFTREGQITINPDRRIKIGNYIYYRPTREIFYVTGVVNTGDINNESVDRKTVITVERGMVKDFVRNRIRTTINKEGERKESEISYFNIVNIQKIKSAVYDVVASEKVAGKFDYKASVEINKDVLDFFLQKRQFDEN